ncbi:Uncharacterized protein SCF082_LOCUS18523 [Durusdinium trenchii]|uniref:Uncharacterized protein n=1 Tax=Durusdinium trenchii TaxID=1381693 RepID=A0ABP0KS73_9DINO
MRFARFARCRNAHLSAWSRTMNFQLHRGIATAPLLRLASEIRPQNGWPEQRFGSCLGFAMQGEASLENGSAATDAVAAILATIVELDAALGSRCSDYLVLSVLGRVENSIKMMH